MQNNDLEQDEQRDNSSMNDNIKDLLNNFTHLFSPTPTDQSIISFHSHQIASGLYFFKSLIEELDREVIQRTQQVNKESLEIGYADIIFDQIKNHSKTNELESIEQKIERIKNFPGSPQNLTAALVYLLDQALTLKINEFNEMQESDRLNREECGDNPLDIFEPEALDNINNYLNR